VCKEAHRNEVCKGGHGDDGGGEVGEQPRGAGEAVRKVGKCGEEHVPLRKEVLALGKRGRFERGFAKQGSPGP